MPNFPFFKLPVAIGGSGLGTISTADQTPMFPPSPEMDAVGHWDLGVNGLSLVDMVNGRVMTPNAAAPSFDASGVLIASGGMNGLLTDISDKAKNFTTAFVVQMQANLAVTGQSGMHFGTMQASAGDGLGGGNYTNGSTSGVVNIQSNDRNAGTSQQITRTLASMATLNSAWIMLIRAIDDSGNRFVYVPGFAAVTDGPITKTPSTRKLALGNAYYNDAAYFYGQKYSEVIVWDRALSQVEAIAVAKRSAERLKYKKGITLYGV